MNLALAESILQALHHRHPLKRPARLEWRRYRTTAGRAHFRENLITLSASILDTEEKLRDTLIHEYAHLLAYERYGRRGGTGHGPAWQHAMRELGAKPEVRHRYECQRNRPRQRVVYRCDGCKKEFHRLRRLPRKGRFRHAGCGGKIEFVRIEALTLTVPSA